MASISKIAKQIKDEVKSNGSCIYYPLYDKELREMQDKNNLQYMEFIKKLVEKLKGDKQFHMVNWGKGWVYSPSDYQRSITINEVNVVGKPCKEFVSLNKWLIKYATRRMGDTEIMREYISGKRSSYEVDSATYFMQDSQKCKNLLQELRKARSSKDTIILKYDENIYWGDRFNSYGEDMEREWKGYKDHFIKFIIKTPTGREKKVITAEV